MFCPQLGHNGATPESCWLVDQLSVAVPTKGIQYNFLCKCWLAKDRGDGLTARVFNILDATTISIIRKVVYEVTVVTGDTQNAGTDTNIFISVFGANGSMEEMLLAKHEDRFERGQEDTFNLEIDDIAPLKKLRVRIDGTGSRPDWFLDKIIMRNLSTEEVYVFTYEEWLSKTKGPKRTKVCELPAVVEDEEMVEKTTYSIQVKTSDIAAAGTDANVFLIVFGENGDTGTLALRECSNRNKFEHNQVDVFRFGDILSLGELSKVRVWHDNKGPAPGWHLEYVDVKDDLLDQTFRFPCDRWLAKSEDDGQIMRELACANNDILDLSDKTKYEFEITTANSEDAETKENVWIILEGKKGRSKEFMMENSKKKKFLRGATDSFEFSSKNVGEIVGICLGHITKEKKVKNESFWHVQEVVITEKELRNKFYFTCDARIPLAAKKDEFMTFECTKTVESFASKVRSLVPVKYEIIIITGDVNDAATDANVFITLYGVNGDSGKRALKGKYRNLFERGRTDRFLLEMLDLGELLRIKVEHDDNGTSSGWYLECVEVTNTANWVTTVFVCGKWLDRNKADGQTHRVLYPKY
ncbi:lipoxygenase homology domain-containing protein 1 isoform X4 [Onychostoma macrolepis]|uniref:lipoxygenase homology domain-containing protein 1 isoform X4 n=1 Tax=Onychostoma macrolepis TaxID=369639 RepID=UPI00272AA509|nr:lipoxygenase homology domain-containing protein 1 isoform X4 [Onychostoma macrolepis]